MVDTEFLQFKFHSHAQEHNIDNVSVTAWLIPPNGD